MKRELDDVKILMRKHLTELGIERYAPEWRFHTVRRWRWDWAIWHKGRKLAVEINGGLFIKGKSGHGGAHSLPTNILRDMEKKNSGVIMGWDILEFTPTQIRRGDDLSTIRTWMYYRA